MRRLAAPVFIVAASLLGGCNAILGIHKGQPPPSCVDREELLIDDMEDGDPSICELKGRTGAWFVVGDGTDVTGSATMALENEAIPGRRDESWRAMHFTGAGFTAWGALAGLNLYVPKLAAEKYDASGAGGITFWMRTNARLDVKLRTPATVERTAGGSCELHDASSNCNNHFRFAITAVQGDWTRYEVPFTALTQQPGGTAVWDPSTLLGIEFAVPANASFDVWIDDLAFYYCAAPSCVPSCDDPALPTKCPISTSPARPAGCFPAGIDCAALGSYCADPSIIDDMEDGLGDICPSEGRGGSWYVVADPSGGTLAMSGASFKPTLIPNGRGTSRYAAALVGSGFTDWGVLMGLHLHDRKSYDASAADGIRFWAKGTVPFNFQVAVPGTIPRESGGTCDDNCYKHLGFWWGDPVADWTEVRVPFAALRGPLAFDDSFNLILIDPSWSAAALNGLEFSVPGWAASEPFELWIDDVSFYSCGGGDCLPTCPASAPVACPAAGDLPAACWPAGTECARATDQVVYNAVWGSGPADVWAVGYSLFRPAGIIRHYDGTSWTAVGGVTVPIWDVWGSGAADAWVVADQGAVGRWDGQAWTSTNSGTNRSYNAIWGSAPDDVWAVVYPGMLRHWDGTAWSTSMTVETFLSGLWGSGKDDVWSVGEAGGILHWNGAGWSTGTAGSQDLFAVWGSRAGDVWAVGAAGTIVRWNGVSWSAGTPVTSHGLYDVWGSGAGDVWAVGDAGTALHFDGSRWTPVAVPSKSALASVWGSGPADVWAVGDSGTIVHWDGTAWSAVPSGR